MANTNDTTSDTVTLDSGQSVSGVRTDGAFTIDTTQCDELLIYIDNGSTGGTPATYDMQVDVYKYGNVDDWMFDNIFTGETARSWSIPASGPEMRIDITNANGTNGETYRIFVESRTVEAN